MRRDFHPVLLTHMRANPRIHLLSVDLGFGMWDNIAVELPAQFHQFSATEQLAMGAAVGMADEGLIPIVYSITPFVLWRAAEWIRNYLAHENAAVKLLAAGRCENGVSDYGEDGWSHDCCDDRAFLSLFPQIEAYWPQDGEEMRRNVKAWLYNARPAYLNLKR